MLAATEHRAFRWWTTCCWWRRFLCTASSQWWSSADWASLCTSSTLRRSSSSLFFLWRTSLTRPPCGRRCSSESTDTSPCATRTRLTLHVWLESMQYSGKWWTFANLAAWKLYSDKQSNINFSHGLPAGFRSWTESMMWLPRECGCANVNANGMHSAKRLQNQLL